MTSITLIWNGPYEFSHFFKNQDLYCKGGVYLHTETISGKIYISYTGKSEKNIVERQQQHYYDLISGRQNIPLIYRQSNKEWIPMQPNDKTFRDTILNKDKYLDLIREAFEYVKKLNIYIATENFNDVKVSRIERRLLYDFKPLNTHWGTVSNPNDDLEIIHDGKIKQEIKTWIANTQAYDKNRSASHREKTSSL